LKTSRRVPEIKLGGSCRQFCNGWNWAGNGLSADGKPTPESCLSANAPIADIRVCFTLARMMKEYVLDGAAITSLEAFYDQVSSSLALGDWGRNLDALDDA